AAVATKAGGIASVTTLAVVVGLRTAARAVAQDYFSDRGQRYVATIAAITCRSRIAAIAATEGSVAAVVAIAIVAPDGSQKTAGCNAAGQLDAGNASVCSR